MQNFYEEETKEAVIPFFKVQNRVIDLPIFDDPYEHLVYIVLCRYSNSNSKVPAFPSIATLARRTNCSENRVIKSLKSLERKKLITKVKNYDGKKKAYSNNLYYVNEIPLEVLELARRKEKRLMREYSEKLERKRRRKLAKRRKTDEREEAALHPVELPQSCDFDYDLFQEEWPQPERTKQKKKRKIFLTEEAQEQHVQKARISEEAKEVLLEWLDYRKEIQRPVQTIYSLEKVINSDWMQEVQAADFIRWCMEHDWVQLKKSYFDDYMYRLSKKEEDEDLPILT